MEQKIDRRILKTRKVIQETFLEMLACNEFDDITIKDIAQKGDISRKTFYLHYLDKYDLLDDIINKELEKLAYICEQKKEKGIVEGTIIWFNYFYEEREFFKTLFRSKTTVSFRDKLLNFMMEQLTLKMDENNIEKDEIVVKFLGMGILGVLESFVLGELDGETIQVSKKIGQLLEKNLCIQ
ncbi:MAG: TetR/AcrR family transcriptional regulator C-terminal domain-containing protein [Sarcina sp.]